MSSLPTCWYCPECGWQALGVSEYDYHPREDGTECRAALVECPVIPPGTPPEQILNLVGDVREGWEQDVRGAPVVWDWRRKGAEMRRAFVVIPREEAKDG